MKLNLDYHTAEVISETIRQVAGWRETPNLLPVQIRQKTGARYWSPETPGLAAQEGRVTITRIWGGGVSATVKATAETPEGSSKHWTSHRITEIRLKAGSREWLWREGWARPVLIASRPAPEAGRFLRLQAEKRKSEAAPQRRRSSRAMFRLDTGPEAPAVRPGPYGPVPA